MGTPATAVGVAAPRVSGVRISIKNPLPSGRSTETVAIRLSDVRALLPSLQEAKTVVVDASGRAVLSQLVDSDGDERVDELIFQTDLGPNGEKTFELGEGVRPTPSLDQFKVYGRFVRERHDDFAWENDRVAHRIYGPALETWQQEPLTSSGVDIWCKRTPRLVINDWYQSDDYHRDNGDGGDFYSVGASRGCGGLGVWSDKQLHVSRNFTTSRVLANGPLRLIFELDYAPWDAGGGTRVSETRRVTVDAGKHFDRFESSFKVTGRSNGLALAIGIGKHRGGTFDNDPERGFLRSWEPLKGENGHVGCAVINASGSVAGFEETATDRLLLTSIVSGAPASYLAGFGWDKGGVADNAAWTALVEGAARELHSPVQVSLAKTGEPPRGAAMPWADRVVSALIERHPKGLTDTWEYDSGLVLKGMLAVWHKTHDAKYLDYVKLTVGRLLDESGNIRGYRAEDYNLDQVNMGKLLFTLLAQAKEEKDRERYRHALTALRDQLKRQPRTRDGLFWHKNIYPHQVWLDGVYMASPFLA